MANIDATIKPDVLFDNVQEDFQVEQYGFLDYEQASNPVARSQQLITPEVEATLRTIENRDHDFSAIKEVSLTTETVESFPTNVMNLGETGTFKAVQNLVAVQFSIPWRTHEGNAVTREQMMMNRFKSAGKAIAAKKDELLQTTADNRKTQLLNYVAQLSNAATGSTWTFNTTPDELQLNNLALSDNFYYKAEQLMRNNFQEGSFYMVSNKGGMINTTAEIAKYGGANQFNQQNALNMPFPASQSANIDAGSDRLVGYLMELGAIGTVNHVPNIYTAGHEPTVADNKKVRWEVTQGLLPYLNQPSPFIYATQGGNTSSTGIPSAPTDLIETWRFHYWFWTITTYNQDLATRPNNIVKIRGSF